jgi:hypothetical protein
LRGSSELAGSNYNDGWGAHCYVPGKPAAGKTSRIGMCFVKSR